MSTIVLNPKGLLSQNAPVLLEVGLISSVDPDNGFLYNITNIESTVLTVIDGSANFFFNNFDLYMVPMTTGTIVIQISGIDYSNSGNLPVTNYFSLWCIPQQYYPQIQDIQPILYGYLPPNCYTDSSESVVSDKLQATSYVLADVYNDPTFPSLTTFFQTIFPPFANDTRWEQMLNTGPSWADSYDYPLVIQTARNVFLQNTSAYDCSLIISTYIFARLGITTFVYIETTPSSIVVHIMDTSLSDTFVQELTLFIIKLFEPQMIFTIELDVDFSDNGIILYIGDTYGQDPRLYVAYALQYSNYAVYNAQALVSPFNPLYITRYYILPVSGMYDVGDIFTMSAIVEYNYNGMIFNQDVTNRSTFVSSDPSVIEITLGNTANAIGIGSAVVTATFINIPFPTLTAPVTYSVVDVLWVLDVSDLDVDTILA